MARFARVVVPGYPHHVTQRGNRRQQTFFNEGDYKAYQELLAEWCAKRRVEIRAYCLMPNHVHLVATPQTADGLATALGETHRRYTRRVNFRENWRGFLWQGRFASVVLDGPHLLAAVSYVERNPVRAGLCGQAWEYPWSSAAAHVAGREDGLVNIAPLAGLVPDWREYIRHDPNAAQMQALRRHERTGRPLGTAGFVAALEALLARSLCRQKPGPKPKRPSGVDIPGLPER
ncbi:MAG: transposase [Kiritimatiellota bacterium]|nr:transposase [Kiritimatiellota bacterium]